MKMVKKVIQHKHACFVSYTFSLTVKEIHISHMATTLFGLQTIGIVWVGFSLILISFSDWRELSNIECVYAIQVKYICDLHEITVWG